MIPGPHRVTGGAMLGAGSGQIAPFGPYGASARDPQDMELEILVVPGCPHQRLAEERLRQALDAAGLDAVDIASRVIDDQAEAVRSGFTGYPTILIDGHDPFSEPGAVPSLACRIYHTPDEPAAAPGIDHLRKRVCRLQGQHGAVHHNGRLAGPRSCCGLSMGTPSSAVRANTYADLRQSALCLTGLVWSD